MHIFEIYNRRSESEKAALWYMVCNFLQKGIAFIVVPIYVRLLTTQEYGHYTLFVSWLSFISVFATLNLFSGVFTKAMVDFPEDRARYTSSMQGLGITATSIIFMVYFLFIPYWNSILEINTTTGVLMFIYYATFPAFSFWSVRQRVENKYKNLVFVTLFMSILTPVIIILLLLNTHLNSYALIWGFLIVQIAFGLYYMIIQFYRGKIFYNENYWIAALKFNIPLIPHYLSLIVLGQVDRILIGKFCGNEKAGIYGLAYQISMVMGVIIASINGALVPWLYEKFKIKEFDIVKHVTNKLCLFVGVISVLIILLAPEVVLLIGTSAYYEAIWVIPPIVIGCYLTFCYGLFSSVEFYYNATKGVMIATLIGACISFILNIILLPRFGFISAGYTSLLCYSVFMVLNYMFMKKVCKREVGFETIFNNRFIFLSCAIFIIFMIVCLSIYNYAIVRYITIFILSLIVLLKNKELKMLFIK